MILSRYLSREVFRSLFAVTLVLLMIFVCQQLVRYLGFAASGKMPAQVMFQVIGYQIPFLLALMLPPGLYFAILLAYGRLYADNELRVLHACGYSLGRLLRVTGGIACLVAVLVACLTFWVNPRIAAERQLALVTGARQNLLDTLMPGRFRVMQDGSQVFYVEKISRDHQNASDVFVARQKPAANGAEASWVVLSAAKGYQQQDPAGGGRFLVAEEGYRYEGTPGHRNYRIFHFGRHGVRLPELQAGTDNTIMEALPMQILLQEAGNPEAQAELQWRLSIPLSVLLLALFAVPICQTPPRKGRYRILLPAILVYVIYMNLLIAGRHLIEQGTVPMTVGLWWVHFLLLVSGVSLMVLRMRRI